MSRTERSDALLRAFVSFWGPDWPRTLASNIVYLNASGKMTWKPVRLALHGVLPAQEKSMMRKLVQFKTADLRRVYVNTDNHASNNGTAEIASTDPFDPAICPYACAERENKFRGVKHDGLHFIVETRGDEKFVRVLFDEVPDRARFLSTLTRLEGQYQDMLFTFVQHERGGAICLRGYNLGGLDRREKISALQCASWAKFLKKWRVLAANSKKGAPTINLFFPATRLCGQAAGIYNSIIELLSTADYTQLLSNMFKRVRAASQEVRSDWIPPVVAYNLGVALAGEGCFSCIRSMAYEDNLVSDLSRYKPRLTFLCGAPVLDEEECGCDVCSNFSIDEDVE